MKWNWKSARPKSSFEQNISIKKIYSIERAHTQLLFARHFCSRSPFCCVCSSIAKHIFIFRTLSVLDWLVEKRWSALCNISISRNTIEFRCLLAAENCKPPSADCMTDFNKATSLLQNSRIECVSERERPRQLLNTKKDSAFQLISTRFRCSLLVF